MTEKRSVIRLGGVDGEGGSLAITIPANFVKNNKIKPGDKVLVLLNRRSLLVTTDRAVAERVKKQLDHADDAAHEEHAAAIQEAFVEESGETGGDAP